MRLRSGWHHTKHDAFGKQRMSIEGALGTTEGISAWNEIVAFRADGNVGIGVHDPSETLHVIGNTYMEGKMFMSHPTDRFKSNTNLHKRFAMEVGRGVEEHIDRANEDPYVQARWRDRFSGTGDFEMFDTFGHPILVASPDGVVSVTPTNDGVEKLGIGTLNQSKKCT